MKNKEFAGKSAQNIQDEIFRTMSPDEKIRLGSFLWQLVVDFPETKTHFERGTRLEDLVLIKLKWYEELGSSRQRKDAESILNISGDALDMEYLAQWAKRLGVEEILQKVLQKRKEV